MEKLEKRDIEDVLALTPMQEGMLFHYLKDPTSDYYFEQLSLEISGEINADIFEKAWDFVIETNEMLRTLFRWENLENPVQIILKEHKLQPRYYDLSRQKSNEKKKQVEKIKVEDRKEKFDLLEVPFRVTLCRLDKAKYVMMISNHHVLYDGWSNGIILKEFFKAYDDLSNEKKPGKPVKTKFKEFVKWIDEQDKDREEKYWRGYLLDFEIKSSFPFGGRSAQETIQPGRGNYRTRFSEDFAAEITDFVKGQKVTPASLFYSGWGILMQWYLYSDDVVFGTVVSGRKARLKGIEDMVGLFINTLPIRIKIPPVDPGYQAKDLLQDVKRALQEQAEYETTSLAAINQYNGLRGDEQLFNSIVVIENYPIQNTLYSGSGSHLKLDSYALEEQTNYNLAIEIKTFDGIEVCFSYHIDLWGEEDIQTMVRYLEKIIRQLVHQPGKMVTGKEILTTADKKRILEDFNNTMVNLPMDMTIDGLFRDQVAKTPDFIALVGPSVNAPDESPQQITYKQLNEQSGRLANLLNEKGVLTETIAGIMIDRSLEMIIAILGILTAGGAYLPIDPEYPVNRKQYILTDSNANVLVTTGTLAKKGEKVNTRKGKKKPVHVFLDFPGSPEVPPSHRLPFHLSQSSTLAYIIYTSGTTGRPKGVMVEHKGVVNYIWWAKKNYIKGERINFPLYTSITFDMTVTSIFTPLITGNAILVYNEKENKQILIDRIIDDNRVEVLKVTPSHLKLVGDKKIYYLCPSIKRFIVGGEELKTSLAKKIFENFGNNIEIYNEYGPTEAAVGCMIYKFDYKKDTRESVPIGHPADNTQIYILDKNLAPIPPGIIGEIYISGDGIARGYLNQPELTEERFINFNLKRNQGHKGKGLEKYHLTLYRTGDLSRWLPGGAIEFLGRIDHQVKIRGFRIELREIENHLLNHPGIKEAVVTVKKDRDNENYLCGWVVMGKDRPAPELSDLKTYLSQKLPHYMVPTYIIPLERLPLTRTGKVDTKTLSEAEINRSQIKQTYMAPQTDVEKIIVRAWKQVLKIDKVGVDDNFFDLGGNSLSIIRLNTKLKEIFKQDIPVVTLFNYPTVGAQARYFGGEAAAQPVVTTKPAVSGDIAVIGMAGRFPGAQNIEEFWDNLKKGKESITFFTDEELETLGVNPGLYHHPHYVKAKGVLESMEYFDALFFDYSAREARLMDPQLRLLHECVWEALENAGYVPGSSNGSIGLYVGSLSNTWWMQRLNKEINSHSDLLAVGSLNDRDYLATRISYKLNLKGPAVTVQTACSTSLVAIDTACQALLGGRCRIALAGGISLTFQDRAGYLYEDGMVRSPDGHCRPFDAGARGTMGGNGVGIVVLKPLKEAAADGDNIRAMIKGSAINNDGARKVGYTAPSVEGQVEVVRSALKAAGIEPESVTYLETHGTGTILGDPVEIEALKQAFNTDKKGFCGIGAVKANIGHLDAAAGAAGFIKTVLALEYRMIPPLVNFQTPNPQIDFENSPFYVNTQFKKWENEIYPLRAGVSSFGLGGTNAHVILEEWPRKREHKTGRREYQLILLSAKTQPALEKMSLNLARYLQENPHLYLQDVAYTLQVGRETFQHRRMVVCSCIDAAIESLSGSNPGKVCSSLVEDGKQQLIFMFPGLGCQYVNMGRDIYEKEPFFRREMDRCFEILASLLDYNIKEILYPDESAKKSGHEENTKEKGIGNRPAGSEGPHSSSFNIHHFEVAQIVIFIFEYALAKLLLKWGIRPQNMIGYSFGEYAAACISGVFSLEDALKLVVARGRLMKKIPPGAMMSVPLPSEKLIPLLPKDLSIAVDNGPSCVVSGPVPAVDAFEKQMKKMRCICMRLPVTHAVHSKMIEPVLEEFKCELRCICLNNPQINYISNVTGQLIKDREVTDPGYWLTHLRETVQFADGLKKLLEEDNAIFIEIGPGRELSAFVQKFITPESHHFTINLIKHASEEVPDHRYLVERIGYLWLYGVSIDWPGFYWGWGEKQRISLPPYPFERQRYWIEEKQPGGDVETLPPKSLVNRKKNIEDWFYIPSWKRSILSLRDNDDPPGAFTCLVFVNECRFCELVVKELVNEGHEVMTVRIGPGFQKENDYTYTINPQQRADYDILLQHLFSTEKIPEKIVHMWNITNIGQGQIGIETISETQYLGFYSLLYLTIAMGQQDFARECQVTVLTNNMQELAGEEWLCPEKATLIGPVRVIPKEYSNINCRSIDILVPGPGSLRERKILNMLRQELRSKITDPVIAYRGNHRWVQSFEPVRLDKTGVDAVRLRKNGVYLITGGLGGIGFAIAQYLLKEFQARLIIVGRTALPLRQDWEKWLAEHEADNQMSQKIRKVLELETLGGEIFLAAADVSVFVQMQKVIAEARKQFGPIQGVIHAAGLPGSSVIQRKTWEMTEPVLAPKVKGTLVLDRLLRDEQLDFFILFSSIDSIIATFGQVDYTAANSFLDAFAHNKASRDGTFCVSINWQGWAEVGMSHRADMKLADELNISPDGGRISPPEGINAFARILENNLIQVVVNVQDFIESVEQNKSSRISELAKSLEKVQSAKVTHSRPRLSSSYIAPSNRTEKLLAEMWQTFFGFECIGVDDNFFELGATSLDLVQLNSRLKDKFKREIPIEKMFTYPTINTLAGYLEGNQEESDNITDHQELERLEVMAESKNRLKRRKKNLREKIVND